MTCDGSFQPKLCYDSIIRQKIIVYLLNGTNSFFFFFSDRFKTYEDTTKWQSSLSFYCYPPQLKYNGYNVFYIAF